MRRATGRTAGLVVTLAALAGCDPPKVAPTAVDIRPGDRVAVPDVPVPAKSDPAAVKVVERCVAAATDGHPERLDKTKLNRATLAGRVARPGGVFVKTARKFDAAWPDRFRLADEFAGDNGPVASTFGLRRPVLWARTRHNGATESFTPPDPVRAEIIFAAEVMGRHWLTLLTPFTDPTTVVFDAKKQTVDGHAADVIRVAVKGTGYPVFTVWFDEKTGHLGRVDFASVEDNLPKAKMSVVAGHKAFGGVMLPTRFDYRENGVLLEEWTADSWEFPEKIDDATFDPPK